MNNKKYEFESTIIAVKKLNQKTTLSKDVGDLYTSISTTGLLEENIGHGLIYMSSIN